MNKYWIKIGDNEPVHKYGSTARIALNRAISQKVRLSYPNQYIKDNLKLEIGMTTSIVITRLE
jgi:hypothetical protein